jgi:hypothetical protein
MESTLRLFLSPINAETLSGDLFEEYRAAIYPRKGKLGADLWLLRQIAGFAWRSAFLGSLILAVFVIGRFALDTFAPPANFGSRSAFSTWSSILMYLTVAFFAARRTRLVRTGMLVAVSTHLIAHTMGILMTAFLFFALIRRDPDMLRFFYQTGGWGEAMTLPLMILPIVVALGSIGGAAGRYS